MPMTRHNANDAICTYKSNRQLLFDYIFTYWCRSLVQCSEQQVLKSKGVKLKSISQFIKSVVTFSLNCKRFLTPFF